MLVFDAEIIKAILAKKEEPISNIEYCKGWKDFKGMGISVVVVWDSFEDRWRVFLEDNLKELQKLIDNTDIVIGFNNENFDNELLAAHDINIPIEKSFDLLKAIRESAGTFKGLGLNAINKANFGITKSESGAMAPVYWQRKEYGKVIDYCLNDVRMTVKLLEKILEDGYIIDPRNEENIINISVPEIMNKYKV